MKRLIVGGIELNVAGYFWPYSRPLQPSTARKLSSSSGAWISWKRTVLPFNARLDAQGILSNFFQTIRFAVGGTRKRSKGWRWRGEREGERERARGEKGGWQSRKEQFLGTRRRDETRRDGGEGILFKAEHFTAARSTLVMENPPAAPTN